MPIDFAADLADFLGDPADRRAAAAIRRRRIADRRAARNIAAVYWAMLPPRMKLKTCLNVYRAETAHRTRGE